MGKENGDIMSRDEDGVPAAVIREMIRRSLESAAPPSGFLPFASILLESGPVVLPQFQLPEIDLNPPKIHRIPDGLLTGFRDFDRIVGGLRPGEIITVAGLPSSGSSTFLQNIVRRSVASTSTSRRVISFFTLDIDKTQVAERLLAAEAKIDWRSASGGFLRDSDWARLTESVQRLWDGKLFVNDDHLVSLDDIYHTCSQRKRGVGLDLIVLDRVNVLGLDPGGSTPPLGDTMTELKAIAEELEVPILLTFTADPALSDDVTHRLNTRSVPPAIQVFSDVLALLHRPDQWESQGRRHEADIPELQKGLEVVELHIARQTGGSSDTLRLAFNARWGRFDNVLWD